MAGHERCCMKRARVCATGARQGKKRNAYRAMATRSTARKRERTGTGSSALRASQQDGKRTRPISCCNTPTEVSHGQELQPCKWRRQWLHAVACLKETGEKRSSVPYRAFAPVDRLDSCESRQGSSDKNCIRSLAGTSVWVVKLRFIRKLSMAL